MGREVVRLGAIRAGWPDCVVGDGWRLASTPKRMCRGIWVGRTFLDFPGILGLEFKGRGERRGYWRAECWALMHVLYVVYGRRGRCRWLQRMRCWEKEGRDACMHAWIGNIAFAVLLQVDVAWC